MGLLDIGPIPVYDLGTLAAGFYVGYMHGKGMPVVETTYLVAPMALAMAATPFVMKNNQKISRTLENLTGKNPCPKLEEKLKNSDYAKGSIKMGTRTAIETGIGYFAGNIYSQFH